MTSTPPEPPSDETASPDPPASSAALAPAPEPPPAATTPPGSTRPGLSTFTIEGRAAPGLFVVGWLATVLGFGLTLVGALSGVGLFSLFLGPLFLTIGFLSGAGSQSIERRARGSAYPGPSPYLVFAAILSAVYTVGSAVGFLLQFVIPRGTLPFYAVTLIGAVIQMAVYVGVIRLAVVDAGALSWRDMGWRRLDGAAVRTALFGAIFALPIIWVTGVLATLLVQSLGQTPTSPLPPTGSSAGLIANLITGVLIAPIGEEAVFRGFAQTAWSRTVGDAGAVVRASLVFAVAHIIDAQGDTFGQVAAVMVIGFATRIPVAFALGWLFARTRSIWTSIGLHMAFNGILLVVAEILYRSGGS